MDNRKLMFVLAALAIGTVGVSGCSDDGGGSGSSSGIKVIEGSTECGGVKCALDHCTADVCDLSCEDDPSACADIEFDCNISDICTSVAACKDVGLCKYECGDVGTCDWGVCEGAAACDHPTDPVDPADCDPTKLEATDDTDGDGIPNGIEIDHGWNPCKADTDGDTIPDGEEDLNHDGVIQEWLGETDPLVPNTGLDVASRRVACNAKKLLNGGETYDLEKFNLAVPKGINTDVALDGVKGTNAAAFDDPAGLALVFTASEESLSAREILKYANKLGDEALLETYVESSNFASPVPLDSWAEFDEERLLVVPKHALNRYVYRATLKEGRSLEDLRDKLGMTGGDKTLPASTKQTICENNEVLVNITRSSYEPKDGGSAIYIYSMAMTCGVNSDSDVATRMLDIGSGTHVAPRFVNDLGYAAYKDFVCQTEGFGDSTAMVDFIWVVDNSGSMADELQNLSNTATLFMNELSKANIDFRIGVTTTDAYYLDEWSTKYDYRSGNTDGYGKKFYQKGYITHLTDSVYPASNPYMSPLGLRFHSTMNVSMSPEAACLMSEKIAKRDAVNGKLDINGNPVSGSGVKYASSFQQLVIENNRCNATSGAKDQYKNICGFGYEDGIKSGVMVLQNLALDASGAYESLDTDQKKIKANWAYQNTSADNVICAGGVDDTNGKCSLKDKSECCKRMYDSCSLRDDALKYIIWVSDEESRQFKEDQKFNDDENLVGCRTGYRLDVTDNTTDIVYSMAVGGWEKNAPTDGSPNESACNESLKQKIADARDNGLTEESTLDEIKALAPEYYNMLMYYIGQYRSAVSVGGKSNIAGFALVGDIGQAEGGFCKPLLEESSAVDGANYGLGYIHLAKFLSQVTDDGANTGKGGGYASICNTQYEDTVRAILQDVRGRLSTHSLKGYPIASTIRVALTKNGTARELKRGDEWTYDVSTNTVTLSYKNPSSEDVLSFSYVIWKAKNG